MTTTGELWGQTTQPIRCEESTYVARHGPGYSRFEHCHDGIELDLVQFVPLDDPLKISVLTIEKSIRALQAPVRDRLCRMGAGHLARGQRPPDRHGTGAGERRRSSCANPWNVEFASRVAFLDLGGRQTAWTAIGPNS